MAKLIPSVVFEQPNGEGVPAKKHVDFSIVDWLSVGYMFFIHITLILEKKIIIDK